MTPYLPVGWRSLKHVQGDDSVYLALSKEFGRGIIKKVDDNWFFIKNKGKKDLVIPLSLLEEVFCLYPLRKYYEDANRLR